MKVCPQPVQRLSAGAVSWPTSLERCDRTFFPWTPYTMTALPYFFKVASLVVCSGSVGFFDVHAVEGIAGHLRPDAVFLHRHLVHLDVIDLELAGLLIHPKVDVIIFVLAARLAEVGAGEIFPLFLEVAHRL